MGCKVVKTGFIQKNYHNKGKRPQQRTGLDSKYNREKWGFIGKEQMEGSGWKVTKRKYQE